MGLLQYRREFAVRVINTAVTISIPLFVTSSSPNGRTDFDRIRLSLSEEVSLRNFSPNKNGNEWLIKSRDAAYYLLFEGKSYYSI